jgi:hypothetical protein
VDKANTCLNELPKYSFPIDYADMELRILGQIHHDDILADFKYDEDNPSSASTAAAYGHEMQEQARIFRQGIADAMVIPHEMFTPRVGRPYGSTSAAQVRMMIKEASLRFGMCMGMCMPSRSDIAVGRKHVESRVVPPPALPSSPE